MSMCSGLFTFVSMWETSQPIFISFLLLLLVSVAHGFNLVQSPDEVVWGVEEKPASLTCTVDENYEWCYWEVTRSTDGVSLFLFIFQYLLSLFAKRSLWSWFFAVMT